MLCCILKIVSILLFHFWFGSHNLLLLYLLVAQLGWFCCCLLYKSRSIRKTCLLYYGCCCSVIRCIFVFCILCKLRDLFGLLLFTCIRLLASPGQARVLNLAVYYHYCFVLYDSFIVDYIWFDFNVLINSWLNKPKIVKSSMQFSLSDKNKFKYVICWEVKTVELLKLQC